MSALYKSLLSIFPTIFEIIEKNEIIGNFPHIKISLSRILKSMNDIKY